MFAVDLHAHTRFFHGYEGRSTAFDPVGAKLLGAVARRYGLDGVALTNHDYYAPLDFADVTPIPGIEVSTTRGHVLVVGPDPPSVTEPHKLAPETVVEMAHDRGCAAIIAHPYRNSTVRDVDDVPFDAVEVNGKHPQNREWVERLAEERGLPLVGGSDAHYPIEVGRAFTVVDADRLTPTSVVDAIRDGRVEARISTWLPHEVIRRGYRAVHDWKGHIQSPEWLSETTDPTDAVESEGAGPRDDRIDHAEGSRATDDERGRAADGTDLVEDDRSEAEAESSAGGD